MYIRKVVFALITAAGLAFAGGPQVRADKLTIDLGQVAQDSKVSAEFKLTNTGNEPLRILNVRTGCGCTFANYDTIIAPGRTSTFQPVIDLKGFRPGRMTRGINITTNAVNNPALTLSVTLEIMAHIDVSERYFDFYDAPQMTVYLSSAKKDLKVSGIVFNPSRQHGGGMPNWASSVPLAINYKFAPADSTRADGLKVYKLEITTPRGGEELGGTFQITTNHPDMPEIAVGGRIK